MISTDSAAPAHVTFAATVLDEPHFFYGTHTHAEHEEFAVSNAAGARIEVVDNISLAPPVPVHRGDRVTISGELITGHGGKPLVHWTHHDPRGRHPGGFIELDGRRYA